MYYVIFFGVLAVLTLMQFIADHTKQELLGKCKMLILQRPVVSDYMLHLFRTVLCLVAASYLIQKNGGEYSLQVLLFTIVMAGLASKTFYPVVAFLTISEKSGVYENGVVAFGGIRLYKNISYYSVEPDRTGEGIRFMFEPSNPFVSRTVYFNSEQKERNKVKIFLRGKCKVAMGKN